MPSNFSDFDYNLLKKLKNQTGFHYFRHCALKLKLINRKSADFADRMRKEPANFQWNLFFLVKSLRDTGYFLDAEALQSNYFDEYSENRVIILRKSLFCSQQVEFVFKFFDKIKW